VWDDYWHVRQVVPEVGHNGWETMSSELGLWYIFGYASAPRINLGSALAAEIVKLEEAVNTLLSRQTDRPPSVADLRKQIRHRSPEAVAARTAFARRTESDDI
jgi:hypothetical protein